MKSTSGQDSRDAAMKKVTYDGRGKAVKSNRSSCKCKWCGGTDHKQKNSNECLCNPKSPIYSTNFTKSTGTTTVRDTTRKNIRARMTYADYVKKSIKFWFDGDAEIPLSQWVVRRVKHEKNVFTCARVSYPRYFQDQTWITLFL